MTSLRLSASYQSLAVRLLGVVACAAQATACTPGTESRTAPVGTTRAEIGVPEVTQASYENRDVQLYGRAWPRSTVTIVDPSGFSMSVTAAKDGAWRARIPSGSAAELYTLTMRTGERTVEAAGRLLILPYWFQPAVLVRAGRATQPITTATPEMRRRPSAPMIYVTDFDSFGNTLISGFATPQAPLKLAVDGQATDRVDRADQEGRFTLVAPRLQGATSREHHFVVDTPQGAASALASFRPPAPLSGAPYRISMDQAAFRIDQALPKGGVQSTLILGAGN